MLPPNFPRLALYALLWAIPALALWLYLLEPALLPFFTAIDNWLLQTVFERARPELELLNGQEWHIHTKILLAEQVPGKLRVWSLAVGKVSNVTLGLPLLWAMLLAIPHQRIRNLLFGTLLISAAIIFALWLRAAYTLTNFLSEGDGFMVFVSKTIQMRLEPASPWLPEVLDSAYLLFAYLAVVIGPTLLAYYLNRDWWMKTYAND